jgi:hypothetical protein
MYIDFGEEKSAKFLKYGCGCYLISFALFLAVWSVMIIRAFLIQ